MMRLLVCRFSVLFLLTLLTACNFPTGNKDETSKAENPLVQAETRSPARTATMVLTPTVMTETGKGEISYFRNLSSGPASQLLSSTVTGLIPFKISFSSTKSVWEVKGTSLGAWKTEFNASAPTKVFCSGTGTVEFTLTGVLVPMGGLIAEGGCFIQVNFREDWGTEEVTCNTNLGSTKGLFENVTLYVFGPVKFGLIEGDQRNDIQNTPQMVQITTWKIQNLNIPQATGCLVGSTIRR